MESHARIAGEAEEGLDVVGIAQKRHRADRCRARREHLLRPHGGPPATLEKKERHAAQQKSQCGGFHHPAGMNRVGVRHVTKEELVEAETTAGQIFGHRESGHRADERGARQPNGTIFPENQRQSRKQETDRRIGLHAGPPREDALERFQPEQPSRQNQQAHKGYGDSRRRGQAPKGSARPLRRLLARRAAFAYNADHLARNDFRADGVDQLRLAAQGLLRFAQRPLRGRNAAALSRLRR